MFEINMPMSCKCHKITKDEKLLNQTARLYVGNVLVQDLMTPPPLGVENVKIQENSEKIKDLRGTLRDPLQPFLGP